MSDATTKSERELYLEDRVTVLEKELSTLTEATRKAFVALGLSEVRETNPERVFNQEISRK